MQSTIHQLKKQIHVDKVRSNMLAYQNDKTNQRHVSENS